MKKRKYSNSAENIFKLPSGRGAALLVRGILAELEKDSARLKDPSDAEALHDFRVNLRRLRIFLKAYSRVLRPLPGALRKELDEIAERTNASRDSEVGVLILKRHAAKQGRKRREIFLRLAELLGEACGHPRSGYVKKAPGKIRRLTRRLKPLLAPGRSGDTLSALNGKLIEKYSLRLKARLVRIKAAGDIGKIHRARISAKHLRYLLEPEARFSAEAGRLAGKLIRFQYLLGKIHDIHILCRALEKCAEGRGKQKIPAAQELDFVRGAGREAAALLKAWEKALFSGVKKHWLGKKPAGFFKRVAKYSSR